MSDADCACALLRGEIDVDQYWRESGEQQVKSAGVLLTQHQQERALRNLHRLVLSLRSCGIDLKCADAEESKAVDCVTDADELQSIFSNYLATYR
ncbi:hypothetical protein DHf2319_04050 [Orrella daihaiensis]|uniref:Uncharacterized protein n=1 Tax=Orrella daihaiensis TaxID=2782176 RepID=A0ABY4ALN2_9BURK|nr:hypothetical protein DHf2319_04050 [Orrella daihaiensis]